MSLLYRKPVSAKTSEQESCDQRTLQSGAAVGRRGPAPIASPAHIQSFTQHVQFTLKPKVNNQPLVWGVVKCQSVEPGHVELKAASGPEYHHIRPAGPHPVCHNTADTKGHRRPCRRCQRLSSSGAEEETHTTAPAHSARRRSRYGAQESAPAPKCKSFVWFLEEGALKYLKNSWLISYIL